MSMKFRMDSEDIDFIKKEYPDVFKMLIPYASEDEKYPFDVPDDVEEEINDAITDHILDGSSLTAADEPLTPKGLKLDNLIWKMYS